MVSPEDIQSTPSTQRSLRMTPARERTKRTRETSEEEGTFQSKKIQRLDDDDSSNSQRKEVGVETTSKSVDPQSKPQYPASDSSDINDVHKEDGPERPANEHGSQPGEKTASTKGQQQQGDKPTATPGTSPTVTGKGLFKVGWSRCKSFKGNSRIIYGFGPQDDPDCPAKYEFGPSKVHTQMELKGLPEVSGKDDSILDISKDGRRKYGFCNIEKVLNVASLQPNPKRKWKPRKTRSGKFIHVFPTMIVNILWCDIDDDDQRLLKNNTSLNFRGNLMRRLKKKEKVQLDASISAVARYQDSSYHMWLREQGINNSDRPLTFFPGEDWANYEPRSGKTGSQSGEKSSGKRPVGKKQADSLSKRKKEVASSETAEPLERARRVPASTEEQTEQNWIHYSQYIDTCKVSFKLTDEMREKDPKMYSETMKDIEDGWDEYRKNMVQQGFKVLPGGEKPEA